MADGDGMLADPVRVPALPAGAAACCAASDAASAGECALCKRAICRNCQNLVNSKSVCAPCRAQIASELAAEQAQAASLPMALAGGVLGAIVCGAAWAAMVVITNLEIGYAAVGVGFVTGWGVLLGSRKKKGRNLQWIAVACSVLGLLIGKYFIVAHFAIKGSGADLSLFDPRLVKVFFKVLPDTLSPFDALWAFIALRMAWRIPRPTTLQAG